MTGCFSQGMKRRCLRMGAALALVLTAAAACGTGAGPNSSSGTLKLVIDEEPLSLNPGIQNTKAVLEVTEQILQPLIAVDNDFRQVKTGLISDWSESAPREWSFQLRKGVSFSNGEPWNAQAAVKSVDVMKASSQGKPYMGSIGKTTATGQYSFKIDATDDSQYVPALLSYVFAIPPRYYDKVGPKAFGKRPIGTGPYVFGQWQPGTSITLSRNDHYWGVKAHIPEVTVSWSPEDSGRQTPLQSHQVDMTFPLPITAIPTVKKDSSLQVVSAQSNRISFLAFNTSAPPFDQVDMRRAATMAINRSKLTSDLLEGLTEPASHFIHEPAGIKGVGRDYSPLPYNPQRAREIVDSYSGQPSIKVSYGVGTGLRIQDVAQGIGSMLRNAGFKVSMDPSDPSAYFSAMFANKLPNVFITSSGDLYPSPTFFADYTMSSTGQLPQCRSKQYDPFISQANSEQGIKAYEALRQAEKIASVDNACLEPLWDEPTVIGAAANLHNIHIRLDQIVDLSQITRKGS